MISSAFFILKTFKKREIIFRLRLKYFEHSNGRNCEQNILKLPPKLYFRLRQAKERITQGSE
jgi:hypothetical protein